MKKMTLILILFFSLGCLTDTFKEFPEIVSKKEIIKINNALIYFDNFSNNISSNDLEHGLAGVYNGFVIDTIKKTGNIFLRSNGQGTLLVNNLDLSNYSSLTFSCWFRSYSVTENTLLSQTGTTISDTSKISYFNGKILLGASALNLNERLPDSIFYGGWNMLTITIPTINEKNSSTGYIVYINGVPYTLSNASLLKFVSGKFAQLFTNFEGDFDKIIIYDKVLSNSEVSQLFNQTKADFISQPSEIFNPKGLLSYYTFDNGNLNDKIGNRNGSSTGSIEFLSDTPNAQDKSIKFSKPNGFVKIEKSLLDNIEKFSISFWVKISNPDYQPLLLQGPNRFDGLHTLALNGKGIYLGNTSYCFGCPAPINYFDNKWHMISITCEGINKLPLSTKMNLYVDGDFYISSLGSEIMFDSEFPLIIGSDGQTVSDCLIDNLRLYNRVLESEEIKSIYITEKK